MKGLSYLSCAVILAAISGQLFAEQEVILKAGTRLIGTVSIDGSDVVVQMADNKVRVPLKDVATIAAENSSPDRQAQRLLLAALEARVMNGTGNEVVGLLAEAKRLAPDDPSIAYWCASTLVDAGYGKAANEVFTSRREIIAKAYPGLVDQLAARIKRRADMERMPIELVKRLDELNAAAPRQSPGSEKRQLFAMFRLVDQNKRPVEQSGFRIESRGEEENLESFDDGYFLFTFSRNRYNHDEPCHLEVFQMGLEPKTFQFSPASNRVADAGELVVSRLDEKSKRPFRIRVVSSDGNPIAGAQVVLQTAMQQSGRLNEVATTTTDLDGRAELLAFPMKYTFQVTSDGFNYQSGTSEVRADNRQADEQKVQLYRAIRAKIRIAWSSTAAGNAGPGATTTGEAAVQATGSAIQPRGYGGDMMNWIRTNQQKDRLVIQFIGQQFGGPGPFGGTGWARVIEPESGTKDAELKRKATEKYNALDLTKIDEFKDKIAAPSAANPLGGYPGSVAVRAEFGKVYVGKVPQRDMRTGQPIELSFKAIVEEMSSDKEPAE